MSDKKISELTASTTPLAGTEVLPIVQLGVTKKTSVESVLTSVQPSGTANGVLYLNGSKVATSGSALFFNGTNLGVGSNAPAEAIEIARDADPKIRFLDAGNMDAKIGIVGSTALGFEVSGAERGRFDSFGNLSIANGNLVIGTSGKGIDFSADGQAAGMTSELLNDYEEGTWTGTITGSVSNPTTPATATGRYTKIGRTVQFQINFGNVNTTGASGHVKVTGLPFTSRGTRTAHTTALFLFDMNTGTSVFALLGEDDTVLNLYASKDDTDWVQVLHSPGVSRYLIVSGTYTTN